MAVKRYEAVSVNSARISKQCEGECEIMQTSARKQRNREEGRSPASNGHKSVQARERTKAGLFLSAPYVQGELARRCGERMTDYTLPLGKRL